MFNLHPEPIPEQETEHLQFLWQEYERKHVWVNDAWEEQHPEVVALTTIEKIHKWEDSQN
jgi:hypothetical protein